MNKPSDSIYATWAPEYRDLGLVPLPLKGKACKQKGWQKDLLPAQIDEWVEKFPSYNIGLRMGTLLPDGTRLGALDVDHDDFWPLAKELIPSPSGRIGMKGGVLFFRYRDGFKPQRKLTSKSQQYQKPVGEWLMEGTLCVIPPSIHPDTKQPYIWHRKPLHKIDFTTLPLIGA